MEIEIHGSIIKILSQSMRNEKLTWRFLTSSLLRTEANLGRICSEIWNLLQKVALKKRQESQESETSKLRTSIETWYC